MLLARLHRNVQIGDGGVGLRGGLEPLRLPGDHPHGDPTIRARPRG